MHVLFPTIFYKFPSILLANISVFFITMILWGPCASASSLFNIFLHHSRTRNSLLSHIQGSKASQKMTNWKHSNRYDKPFYFLKWMMGMEVIMVPLGIASFALLFHGSINWFPLYMVRSWAHLQGKFVGAHKFMDTNRNQKVFWHDTFDMFHLHFVLYFVY